MLLAWTGTAALLWHIGSEYWDKLLSVGFAHLLAGRAISIAQGTFAGLPKWAITLIATYADITGMLIVYPLFVYSYEHFFEGRFFQERMKPMLDSAQSRVDRFRKSKAVGVFFFVWLPFWMTGVIVGAILGYLLGLRTWVTLLAASLGALAAVATWVYAYDILFRWLSGIHQSIPLAFTLILIIVLLGYRFWRNRQAPSKQDAPA
ncbi:MAG: small multi-drug export protein [Kiritimatiellae bacterium]|nr:small multi-drug export protein [Kiritimatiellia bacterium]